MLNIILMSSNKYTHEQSYNKEKLVSIVHRNRLKVIHEIISENSQSKKISWADFGCSNGFIIYDILKKNDSIFSNIVGFDNSKDLLQLAKKRSLYGADFKLFDLNLISNSMVKYDLVTCFETLEHVGNPANAIQNIFNHLSSDGTLFLTLPNEVGFIGLFKFLGRYLLRKKPYGDFFKDKSFTEYIKSLLLQKPISKFRKDNEKHYGPHLGFDYRNLEEYISNKYIKTKKLKLIEKRFTSYKTNVAYIYKKI